MRAPGLFQVDLALQKRFVISGPRNIEFRWEAFNAFNRVNLGAPGTAVTSPTSFGRITGPLNRGYGTGTARQMQFMLTLLPRHLPQLEGWRLDAFATHLVTTNTR